MLHHSFYKQKGWISYKIQPIQYNNVEFETSFTLVVKFNYHCYPSKPAIYYHSTVSLKEFVDLSFFKINCFTPEALSWTSLKVKREF